MPDDDLTPDMPDDRTHVDLGDPQNEAYWTEALGATTDELALAVESAGSSVDAVKAWLAQKPRPRVKPA